MQSGKKAEAEFAELAMHKLNAPVVKSSDYDDINHHIDFYVAGQSYDVKARRSIRRGEPVQDAFVYIELTNVRGDNGWLFGKADWIVFEQEQVFILSQRKRLVDTVRGLIDTSQKCSIPEPYRIYTRNGRQDRITLIPTADILLTEPEIWRKINQND